MFLSGSFAAVVGSLNRYMVTSLPLLHRLFRLRKLPDFKKVIVAVVVVCCPQRIGLCERLR
jgi:hypothetical protein